MSGDLRDFIALLERHGELARVQTPVSADLEISEIYFRHARSPAGERRSCLKMLLEASCPSSSMRLARTDALNWH
jgi:UbiD family decarboxylase